MKWLMSMISSVFGVRNKNEIYGSELPNMNYLIDHIRHMIETLPERKFVTISGKTTLEYVGITYTEASSVIQAWVFASYNNHKIAYVYIDGLFKIGFLNVNTHELEIVELHEMCSKLKHKLEFINDAKEYVLLNNREIRKYCERLNNMKDLALTLSKNQ